MPQNPHVSPGGHLPALSSFQEGGLGRSLLHPRPGRPLSRLSKEGGGWVSAPSWDPSPAGTRHSAERPHVLLGRDLQAKSTWRGLLSGRKPGSPGSSPSLWLSLHVAQAGHFASPATTRSRNRPPKGDFASLQPPGWLLAHPGPPIRHTDDSPS